MVNTPFGALSLIALLPLWILHLLLLYMSWKRWGVAVNNSIVAIRKGVLGVDHIFIPAFKIQEIGRLTTPLMQRHQLSSVNISVASRSLSVPFLPDEVVRGLIDWCLYHTESTNRSWM